MGHQCESGTVYCDQNTHTSKDPIHTALAVLHRWHHNRFPADMPIRIPTCLPIKDHPLLRLHQCTGILCAQCDLLPSRPMRANSRSHHVPNPLQSESHSEGVFNRKGQEVHVHLQCNLCLNLARQSNWFHPSFLLL